MIILLLQNSVDQSLFDKFPLFYQIHFPLHSFWITWFSWRDSPMTICVRLHLETKKRKIFSKKAHWKKPPDKPTGTWLATNPHRKSKKPTRGKRGGDKGKSPKSERRLVFSQKVKGSRNRRNITNTSNLRRSTHRLLADFQKAIDWKWILYECSAIFLLFTVRNPFTATFSVVGARSCAYLRVFALLGKFENSTNKKDTVLSFYVNSRPLKTYIKPICSKLLMGDEGLEPPALWV